MSTPNSAQGTRGPYNERKVEKYWGVYYLKKGGHTVASIAMVTGMPTSTVQSIIDRINKNESPLPSKAPGAPFKIQVRAENMLKRAIRNDPFMSYREVQEELSRVEI